VNLLYDIIIVVKSMLTDPKLFIKYFEGDKKEITPCIACNE